MNITAKEYHLLVNKILPQSIVLRLDTKHNVYFLNKHEDGISCERVKIYDILKQYIADRDKALFTSEEKDIIIGLLLKCIK